MSSSPEFRKRFGTNFHKLEWSQSVLHWKNKNKSSFKERCSTLHSNFSPVLLPDPLMLKTYSCLPCVCACAYLGMKWIFSGLHRIGSFPAWIHCVGLRVLYYSAYSCPHTKQDAHFLRTEPPSNFLRTELKWNIRINETNESQVYGIVPLHRCSLATNESKRLRG